MFYVLFKKVIDKVNQYDKCAKNPFSTKETSSAKHIKFKNKGSSKPAKTFVWIDKDD